MVGAVKKAGGVIILLFIIVMIWSAPRELAGNVGELVGWIWESLMTFVDRVIIFIRDLFTNEIPRNVS